MYPDDHLIWYAEVDSGPRTPMGNMAIKYLGLFHILLSHLNSYILYCFLQNVKSDDEGTYYCLAENKDGKNTYKVNLVVKGEETNDKQECIPVGCVPSAC